MRTFLSILILGMMISACNGGQNQDADAQRQLAAKVDSISRPQLDTLHFMVEEKPCLAVIDRRYKDFKQREEFRVSLFVTLKTESKDANGHPSAGEARIHAELESEILNRLNAAIVNAYIGKTTMNGFRDLMFYIKADDQQTVTDILAKLKQKHSRIKEFTFENDPQWEAVSEFFEALNSGTNN